MPPVSVLNWASGKRYVVFASFSVEAAWFPEQFIEVDDSCRSTRRKPIRQPRLAAVAIPDDNDFRDDLFNPLSARPP